MAEAHCPGQDLRNWKPEDIREVSCPACGNLVEIWKDEPERACPKCQKPVYHPRVGRGCADWCIHGKECQTGSSEIQLPEGEGGDSAQSNCV